jgi:two-component system sensor histidine kinase/response regulator
LDAFFDTCLEMLCVADLEGRFVRVNEAWGRLLGYEPGELAGRSFMSFVHPEDLEATRGALGELSEDRLVERFTNRYRAADGSYRCIEWRSRRVGEHVFAAARDTTEERRREAELVRLTRRLEESQAVAGVGSWAYEPSTGEIFWSKEIYRIFGRDESLPAPEYAEAVRYYDDESEERVRAAIAQTARDGTPYDLVLRLRDDSRGVRFVRAEGRARRGEGGVVVGLYGTAMDVTEQVRRERDLRELSERLEESQAVANVGSWTHDLVTGKVSWSRQLFHINGRDPDGPLPGFDGVLADYDDESAKLLDAAVREAAVNGTPYELVLRTRHGRNGVRFVRAKGRARRDAAGRVIGLYGTAMDVTAEVERERELRLLMERLEESQEVASVGSWAYDLATGGVSWSRQMFNIYGYDPAGAPPDYEGVLADYDDESAERLDGVVGEAVANGTPYEVVLKTRHGRNGVRYIKAKGRARRDADGAVVGLYGTAMDVTQQVEREAALRDARAEAEAASRAKGSFLANMSHEIRTPMTAILGYADLLHTLPREDLSADLIADAIETIRKNGAHLLALINDILDMSRIEAGKMTIESHAFDPRGLATEVVDLLASKASARAIGFGADFEGDLPPGVIGDTVRVRQVLLNLAGNAIKFTDAGSVRVGVAWMDGGPNEGRLLLSVLDTGIGMTGEQVRQVMTGDAFTQADSSMSRRYGGSGLGLRICRELVALMGGRIDVSSEVGHGTEFRVELPMRRARTTGGSGPEPDEATAVADRTMRGLRILLAEDGVDNQRLIRTRLERLGAAVSVVEDGQAAVRAVRQHAVAGAPFDLVLMDMQMPVMDGYEAARALSREHPGLPVVALTAHAMSGDRERCLAAGCVDYLTKPIEIEALVGVCSRWTARRKTA